MSDLPDAVDEWPREPHRVLGVDADTDERGVKRAYAKLLRRFPPDEFPTHFARLNGAKESLLARAQSTPDFSADWFAADGSEPEDETRDTDEAVPEAHEPRDEDVVPGEVVRLWRLAVEGDSVAAYRDLREMAVDDPRASLAAYWLLRLDETLDVGAMPTDRLLAAVDCPNLPVEWLRQLLSELTIRPQLSLDDRLGSAVSNPVAARVLLSIRWSEACRTGRFDVVDADLRRLEWVDPEVRTEVCRLALRRVCLFFDPDAARLTRRLVEEAGDVSAGESRWLEVELAAEVDRLRDEAAGPAYAAMLKLMATWPAGVRERREHLRPLLSGWWRRPGETLPRLDELYGTAPVLMMTWSQRLSDMLSEDLFARDAVKAAISALATELPRCGSYSDARTLLLRVCRSYLIPASQLPWWHGLIGQLPPETWSLANELSEDVPLWLITAAWCVHVFE